METTRMKTAIETTTGTAVDLGTALDLQQAINKHLIGQFVIARCTGAGVHAGTLVAVDGQSGVLLGSRRLWRWDVADGMASLSGIALVGISHPNSRIGPPITLLLTEVCEFIVCTDKAKDTILSASQPPLRLRPPPPPLRLRPPLPRPPLRPRLRRQRLRHLSHL
jgi:hypothetical protein